MFEISSKKDHILYFSAMKLNDVTIGDKKFLGKKCLIMKNKEMLLVTGQLRTIRGLKNLFIQKDLIFWQRQEWSERRQSENEYSSWW